MAKLKSYNTNDKLDHTYLSTGNFNLDVALRGGIPEGGFFGLFGQKSSGKTTLSCNIMREALAKYPNSRVLYIGTEADSVSDARFKTLGVDLSRLDTIRESNAADIDKCLKMASSETSVTSGKYSVIVFDSINAMVNDDDLKAEGVGYSKKPQWTNKMLSLLNQQVNKQNKADTDSFPLTVVLCLQVAQNLDTLTNSFKPYLIKGGKGLEHIMSCVVNLKSTPSEIGTSQSLKLNSTTDYPVTFLAKHPVIKEAQKKLKPFLVTSVSFEKHRGIYRQRLSYVVPTLSTAIFQGQNEDLQLKNGQEYLPFSLFDLANTENLVEGRGRIPVIDLDCKSREEIITSLALGVNPKTKKPIDVERLQCLLIMCARYYAFKNDQLDPVPKDGYLCGKKLTADAWKCYYDEVVSLKEKETIESMAEYANFLESLIGSEN